MHYLPVFFRVDGLSCVVVGSGDAAERRVRSLLKAQARVKLISTTLTPALGAMAQEGTIAHRCRDFQSADLDGAALVYVASDDPALSAARRVLREREGDSQMRARRLNGLAGCELPGCLARGEWARAERLVIAHIGVKLVELGIDPALFNIERSDGNHSAR